MQKESQVRARSARLPEELWRGGASGVWQSGCRCVDLRGRMGT